MHGPLPLVTYIILGLTCLVSWQAFNDTAVFHRYLFNPYQINQRKEWYRFFTHALIHANMPHLVFNMLTLYFFGPMVETFYKLEFGMVKGTLLYILLYVSSVMMSSLFSYEKHKNNMYYNAVGASGAISAVVYAWILFQPTGTIQFMFIPIPLLGFVYGIVLLFVESYFARKGNTGIGHDAHFWGAVYGFALTVCFKFSLFTDFINEIRMYVHHLVSGGHA
jgi:membrane associated rhomboid family serine protease